MSSTRVVRVTGSVLVLVTSTPKVKAPPGSGRLAGVAVLSTVMEGPGPMVTVAEALPVPRVPSSSTRVAVTVSVWVSP